jgi:transcriptional regulator
MHPNAAFRTQDADLAAALVTEIGFATIFAMTPDGPRVGHAPVILDGDNRLLFHLARGNALTRHLGGATALAVVNGPDGYVSPGWYEAANQVPTWNYVAVEMEGQVEQLSRDALIDQVDRLSAHFEARVFPDAPWTRAKMDAAIFSRMLDAISGFAMTVQAWRPTLKLSQNKPAAERARVVDGLRAGGHGALAHLMEQLVKEDGR